MKVQADIEVLVGRFYSLDSPAGKGSFLKRQHRGMPYFPMKLALFTGMHFQKSIKIWVRNRGHGLAGFYSVAVVHP